MSADSPDISEAVKSQWVRSYLQKKCELKGQDFNKLSGTFIEKAEIEFAFAELVSTYVSWQLIIGSFINNLQILANYNNCSLRP